MLVHCYDLNGDFSGSHLWNVIMKILLLNSIPNFDFQYIFTTRNKHYLKLQQCMVFKTNVIVVTLPLQENTSLFVMISVYILGCV